MPGVAGSEQRVLTPALPLATLALGGVLVLAAAAGPTLTAAAVGLLGLVLALGWPDALDLPSPRGVAGVLAVTAVAAAVCAAVELDLRWVPVALAGGLVLSFLHQLLRRDGRTGLVTTLAGSALGIGVLGGGAGYVAARGADGGPVLVGVGVLAVLVGALTDLALHRRGSAAEWALPLGMALAGALAALLAPLGDADRIPAFVVALAAAAVGHGLRRVLTQLEGARDPWTQAAVAAATVLLVGVLPYAAGRF